MHARPRFLLNTPDVELWPAWLLRARGNADARLPALADWLRSRGIEPSFMELPPPQTFSDASGNAP